MKLEPYDKCARQTEYFMMRAFSLLLDVLPIETQIKYSLLDLGARSGHGSGLIKRMFAPGGGLGLELDVYSSNFHHEENLWFREFDWGIEPSVVDINSDHFLQGFDIVIASHMIEHTRRPHDTFRNISKIAKKFFVIACPYREQKLHHGDWWHDSSIDQSVLFDIQSPVRHRVVHPDPGYPYASCYYGVYKAQ